MFIVLEGVDRVGKTTTINHVAQQLRELKYDVVVVSESNDPVMQIIKQSEYAMEDIIPMVVNMRSEHQHLIADFVESKRILLWDRYFDSTWVYGNSVVCGHEHWEKRIFDAIVPDITIYIYGDIDVIHTRIGTERDRFTTGDKDEIKCRHELFVELYKSVASKRYILSIDVTDNWSEFGKFGIEASKINIAGMVTSSIVNKYIDELARGKLQ